MDTEEIISRCPELVLVDELAHTNVQGSKKRYEYVLEILDASAIFMFFLHLGLDLFTPFLQRTGLRFQYTNEGKGTDI
jgi:hypothetical protein